MSQTNQKTIQVNNSLVSLKLKENAHVISKFNR